jgi:hypothetical protein
MSMLGFRVLQGESRQRLVSSTHLEPNRLLCASKKTDLVLGMNATHITSECYECEVYVSSRVGTSRVQVQSLLGRSSKVPSMLTPFIHVINTTFVATV